MQFYLLLKNYFETKKIKEECNENVITILFFYSNNPEYVGLSENEGIVLGFIKKKYGNDKIKVYSLDIDLDLQSISYLKERYNITRIPSLVIENEVYGYLEKEELEEIIKKKLSI